MPNILRLSRLRNRSYSFLEEMPKNCVIKQDFGGFLNLSLKFLYRDVFLTRSILFLNENVEPGAYMF